MNITLPSGSSIVTFLTTIVLPPVVGALATWLIMNVQVLGTLGFTQASIAQTVMSVAIFAVTTAVTWLTQHHILAGHYAPTGKPRL